MLNSFAPPFKIVCGYFIFGFLFLFFAPLILWQSYFSDIFIFSPNSIAVVHFFLLGFVLNIIIGSLYQLTSVVLESKFGIIKFAVFNQIIFNIALLLFC
ncbi:MAG: peptidase M50, partial [Campylobacter sp.]|nr:peptidase M50 [Campylobacter sp.]